jgi:hypothetical protein
METIPGRLRVHFGEDVLEFEPQPLGRGWVCISLASLPAGVTSIGLMSRSSGLVFVPQLDDPQCVAIPDDELGSEFYNCPGPARSDDQEACEYSDVSSEPAQQSVGEESSACTEAEGAVQYVPSFSHVYSVRPLSLNGAACEYLGA